MRTLSGYARKIAMLIAFCISLCSEAQTDTVISLITCYPGGDIYELDGHTALRVNMGAGKDYAVNYGLFDFNSPNFVYRFVKGETDYMVGQVPFDFFVSQYRAAGRRVEEQVLDLTSEEKSLLMEYLRLNLLPENRVYRYNYVKDNCATRPFEIVERAAGDSIMLGKARSAVYGTTYRDVMRHFHRNYPWYQFGIDLILGSGLDYKLKNKEYTFLPMILASQMDSATVGGGRHLVYEKNILADYPPENAVENPTPWYLGPIFVCWLVFALLVIATVRDLRRGAVTRWIDALYFGIMGVAGLLLTFLIFVSVHEATSPNWLYLWLNPLCFIPTIFIWLKKCKSVVFCYQIVNFAVVILLLIAWPLIPQSANAAFLPLVLGDLLRSGSYIIISRKDRKI